jgi:hypothetical protein
MLLPAAIAEGLLFLGGMAMNVFIVPTLLDADAAVPRKQSIPSAMALIAMTIAYISLGLYLPMLSVAVGAVLWILVALYRHT